MPSADTLIIPVAKLPSKGYGYHITSLEISPMVYADILEYQKDLEASKNALSDFQIMLRHLLLPLQHGADISLYDASALLAFRSFVSVCKELSSPMTITYHCPVHDKQEQLQVTMDNIQFGFMDKALKKIKAVKLKDKERDIIIPTISQFLELSDNIKTLLPANNAIRYLYILSMFADAYGENVNELVQDFLSADTEDIFTLEWLYAQITSGITGFNANCHNGKEPVVVFIDTFKPITEIFQNILSNRVFNQVPIIFREDD